MNKVLTLGLGKVGTLVATLLSKKYTVTSIDRQKPHYDFDFPFNVVEGDVTDEELMRKLIGENDAVVSALPYFLNKNIAKIAHELGKHYFDLTEDVDTTNYIRNLAKTSKGVMAPQCGLAPGVIGIIGASLTKGFDTLRSIEMRVGALPTNPNGQMGYSFNWSADGVVNEYINDAEVIHQGVRKMAPSLEAKELINIEGAQFEAFYTSGGLGTMCETYEGKVDTLNYKTIRYPGHCDLMKFLLQELNLKDQKDLIRDILEDAKPPVAEDVVYIYAVVEGKKDGKWGRNEYNEAFHKINIDDQPWRAISWTTACGIVAIIEMVDNGTLPAKGFIKQEEVPFDKFLETDFGSFFEKYK